MKVATLSLLAEAANVSPEHLAKNPNLSEPEKIAELSRQFEAVLLRQILSSARKVVHPSKFNPQTVTDGIYQDLVTNQLADSISRNGGLGLAETLREQLTRQLLQRPDALAGTEAVEAESP